MHPKLPRLGGPNLPLRPLFAALLLKRPSRWGFPVVSCEGKELGNQGGVKMITVNINTILPPQSRNIMEYINICLCCFYLPYNQPTKHLKAALKRQQKDTKGPLKGKKLVFLAFCQVLCHQMSWGGYLLKELLAWILEIKTHTPRLILEPFMLKIAFCNVVF